MKKNITLSYIFAFLSNFYIDLALWTIYLTDKKGFSIFTLGVLQGIFILSKLVFEIPSGIVSDKIGRVNSMIISSLALLISNSFILFGKTVFEISISYILFGISMAFISGTFEAFVFDTLKAENKEAEYKRINTNIYLLAMLSMSGAMILGGMLSRIDMNYMYIGNIMIAIISISVCFFMTEPARIYTGNISGRTILLNSINYLLNNKQLLLLVIFITSVSCVSNLSWHFSQKHLSDLGMSNIQISAEAVFTTIICGIAAKLAYKLEKKLSVFGISLVSSLMLSVPLAFFGTTQNLFAVIIFLTFVSSSISFADPLFSFYINEKVNSSDRATFLSIKNFGISIFTLLFVSMLGLFQSIQLSFLYIGLMLIPVYVMMLFFIKKLK